MKVRGERHLDRYHALIRGSALRLWDPSWPELVYPHASAIDTPLPKPKVVVEAALAYAPAWVDMPKGSGHVPSQEWPAESLEEWHERHGLLSP